MPPPTRRKLPGMRRQRRLARIPASPNPSIRVNGALQPSTWDEALDRAAEGFRRNLDARGPDAPRHLQLLEVHERSELPGAEARPVAFGTNNIDSCNRT